MEKRGLATFTYTEGEYEVDPPVGWEHYFGSRPLYRFLDAQGGDAFEALRRLRQLPRGLTPEATLRLFQDVDCTILEGFVDTFQAALGRIHRIIAEDPEIDAILGYSEGAMIAASVLHEENERWAKAKVPKRLKVSSWGQQPRLDSKTDMPPVQFGVFFSGTPPMAVGPEGLEPKLADECSSAIDTSTFHVFGSNDPLMYSAVTLYNVCNQETAVLWDHGLGHLVPRDAETVGELGDILEGLISGLDRVAMAGTDTSITDYTDYTESERSDNKSDEY